MHRSILPYILLTFAAAALSAQQPGSSDPYQGQSNPPADDTITASQPEQAKPSAGRPMVSPNQTAATPQPGPAALPESVDPSLNTSAADMTDGTDDGIVRVAPSESQEHESGPGLTSRTWSDPDGDIVHPHHLSPGELGAGAIIRVRLMTRLSTTLSAQGEKFRSRVASDVLQDGQVLIPAGAEIDGRVVEVSEGRPGGHGSIRLRPDTVVLTDGQRFRLDAQITGAPGTRNRVNGEGTIDAGSRWRKDGIEYGAAVGAGAVTGAVIGGPVGALAGGLIGAGAITVHLLVDHPQANLEPGTVLLITLNSRLNLVAASTSARN